ncbi:MAG: hypothetical protein Q8927_08635 [Bacteroidota bacterium]|nr:hypothetical protein [Bacteroidota bacterium]
MNKRTTIMNGNPRKINKNELEKIFSKNGTREEFIEEHGLFLSDNNTSFYKEFIRRKCSSQKSDLLIQLMELSIKVEYYNSNLLDHLLKFFYSGKYDFRLAFVDYLYSLRTTIGRNKYEAINSTILKKVRNFLLKFQAALNLCAIDEKYHELFLKLLAIAQRTNNNYAFYRFAYFYESHRKRKDILILKDHVVRILKGRDLKLSKEQKRELLKMLSS